MSWPTCCATSRSRPTACARLGVCDVIIDPGFGFAKTVDQNYALLGALKAFRTLGPVLAAYLARR